MDGQWFGRLTGDDGTGFAILDLDNCGDHFRGSTFFFDDDIKLPGTYGFVRTADQGDIQSLDIKIQPLDRRGAILSPEMMARSYPDVSHAAGAKLDLERHDFYMDVKFQTYGNVEIRGSGRLYQAVGDDRSRISADSAVSSWDAFKNKVGNLSPRKFIFRGQPCLKRLRTSFHRTNRSDLVRFIESDVYQAHQAFSPLTRHFYDLSDPRQLGAFYSLMQHHGYPTPFLDWSYSPFIASYFAFNPKSDDLKVRIFMFDYEGWMAASPPPSSITYVPPHLSVIEFMNIENPRAGPQQAISLATNIDNVESLVKMVEDQSKQKFMYAFDFDSQERRRVLDDLGMMGITPATLFPGLDGTCEALKNRLFDT